MCKISSCQIKAQEKRLTNGWGGIIILNNYGTRQLCGWLLKIP